MKQITAEVLHQKIREGADLWLIDVREPFEHEAFHIGGELLPYSEIMLHSEKIPKNRPVILYCQKGIRSQLAIQRLQDKFGYTNLINLQGGMAAWKKMIHRAP